MRHYFIFKNENSLDDYNLLVTKGFDYKINNENYEEIEIEGRSGTLTRNKGTYPDLLLPFELMLMHKNKYNIYDLADKLTDWLTDLSDNNDLIYDREDRCYKVKKVIFGDLVNDISVGGSINIDFLCEPFKYIPNEADINLATNGRINYLGTVPGKANIKIYGNGNIQLTINNETVQINNVDGYVELDSKLSLCLNQDKTSKSRDMIGKFPLISRGDNNISWVGNVTRVTIQPRTAFK